MTDAELIELVETKAPDKITAESVMQAESYAILLHAPYFLVTDGRRWHWYQTGKDGGGSSRHLEHEILPRHGHAVPEEVDPKVAHLQLALGRG